MREPDMAGKTSSKRLSTWKQRLASCNWKAFSEAGSVGAETAEHIIESEGKQFNIIELLRLEPEIEQHSKIYRQCEVYTAHRLKRPYA